MTTVPPQTDDSMAGPKSSFPSSASSLIFPAASQGFSTTLKSLRRSTLSIPNRLDSIKEDSNFVEEIAKIYNLPLVANERCGSWYIPPEKKAGSAYFKSTDGHAGQWSFSLRRLNLQLLSLIGEHRGCIIVDSTRRGKLMPDALSKTAPIWVAVFNRALFPEAVSSHRFQTPPGVLDQSEIAQIESRLDEFVYNLRSLKLNLEELRTKIRNPICIKWINRDNPRLEFPWTLQGLPLVLLCSASRRVKGAEMSGGGYIQGAGDDSEGWSLGLTPDVFWENQALVFQTAEEDLPDLITSLMRSQRTTTAGEAVLIKPTQNLYLCQYNSNTAKDFDFVIACSEFTEYSSETGRVLNLNCPEGKLGSRDLRKKLSLVKGFLLANRKGIQLQPLLITCSTGKDLSVGIALVVLCIFYDDQGNFLDRQDGREITKQLVRERLALITTAKPDANPSRSTLQAVNSFLMERP